MSKTYSAGIVTAYGAAKRAGYQGTYEDFCRQQAGYAESAAAVEQAKNTAVSAANTATTKAGEATTAATDAQTAKTQTEAAASQALTDISTARSGAISAVQTEGQTQTANARAQAQAAAGSATTAGQHKDAAATSATNAASSATDAAAFATSAANAASAALGVLESIPQDYSDLSSDVDQLKADLNEFENTIFVEETIKTSNLLNISNATTGYYWSSGHVDSNSYNNTGYIEVEEGKTLTFQYGTKEVSGNRVIASMRFIAAYDENKNFVSSASKTSQTSYTVPNGIKYVILGIANGFLTLDNTKWPAVVYSTELIAHEDYFEPYTATEIKESVLPKTVRRQINILSTDSESDIIEKLVNAYNTGDTDVLFERADYSFGNGLANIETTYNLTSNEIPIGNGCRYFFNGSTLEAYIDLSQHPTAEGEDEFYCNFFGCQRSPSSYEMYDGVLIATDTRYVVHDESSAKAGTYKHIYKNVEMHYRTNTRQEAIRKCIGGGTGADGVVEIIGCKFTTDGTDSCVSYHGNSTDVAGAEFGLNISNSWFSNNVRGGVLSQNQTARLFYCGNSAGGNPITYDRWDVTSFLNEVRS